MPVCRVRVEPDIPESAKVCPCGCQLSRIGETTSEQFDLEPAKARVICHVRFKYACRTCEGSSHDGPAVITAPLPAQPIPKSNASPGLLAHIATAKYQDGLPLYRLEGILARSAIAVSRATAANWMVRLGQLVTPVITNPATIYVAFASRRGYRPTPHSGGRPSRTRPFFAIKIGGFGVSPSGLRAAALVAKQARLVCY